MQEGDVNVAQDPDLRKISRVRRLLTDKDEQHRGVTVTATYYYPYKSFILMQA